MTLRINGNDRTFSESTLSVAELLVLLELGPQPVLVERNGIALLKREFETETLHEGDRIEIVRMVAGG